MTALIERPIIEDATIKLHSLDKSEVLPVDDNYELINGGLIEMPGASGKHGRVVTILSRYLDTHTTDNQLGKIFSNARVALSIGNEPIPDLTFVVAGRLPNEFRGAIPAIPDLVVEVNSPTDTTEGIHDKLVMYREAGVRLVWSVFLLDEYILIHRLKSPKIQLLNLDDELDGEDVIPGFKLKVSTIFEQ